MGRINFRKEIEKFPIREGIRQGGPIYPKLFAACLERGFRKPEYANSRIQGNGEYCSRFIFAAVVTLFDELGEVQKMLKSFH